MKYYRKAYGQCVITVLGLMTAEDLPGMNISQLIL